MAEHSVDNGEVGSSNLPRRIGRRLSLSRYAGREQGEGSKPAVLFILCDHGVEPSPQPSPGVPGEGVKKKNDALVAQSDGAPVYETGG